MWFVTMVKFRRPPTRADSDTFNKRVQQWASKGVKLQQAFYTLGRYDVVFIIEAPDEKTAMQFALTGPDFAATETMVAVKREEVVSWLK